MDSMYDAPMVGLVVAFFHCYIYPLMDIGDARWGADCDAHWNTASDYQVTITGALR